MKMLCVLALIVFRFPLNAQDAQFDVASLRPAQSNGPSSTADSPGRFTATNAPLRSLIGQGFGVPAAFVIGPDWLDSDRYTVEAKAADSSAGMQEMMPMLRSLLKERLGLDAHMETREMPVFALVIDRGGPKLPEYHTGDPFTNPPRGPGRPVVIGIGPMKSIARQLAAHAGRPVIDKTGLTGIYRLSLVYSSDTAGASDAGAPPDFFTAVREQLGLRLEPTTGPVDTVRVDHAARVPAAN